MQRKTFSMRGFGRRQQENHQLMPGNTTLTNCKQKDRKRSHAVLRTLGNTLWEICLWNVLSVQTGSSVALPLHPIKGGLRFWITAEVYTPHSESLLSKTTFWFSLEYVHSGPDQPGSYSVSKTWQVYSQRWVERQFIQVQLQMSDLACNSWLGLL